MDGGIVGVRKHCDIELGKPRARSGYLSALVNKGRQNKPKSVSGRRRRYITQGIMGETYKLRRHC